MWQLYIKRHCQIEIINLKPCFENHFFKKMKNNEGVKGKWGRKEVGEGFRLQNFCRKMEVKVLKAVVK